MDLEGLQGDRVLQAGKADVGRTRERVRQRRLRRLVLVLGLVGGWMWARIISGEPLGRPEFTDTHLRMLPIVILVLLLGAMLVLPYLGAGRSPHVIFRAEEIPVGLEDVKGIPVVVEEAVKTLNLFLAHATFKERMGGTSRRAMLFEGPPGTGKTHLAKALAREAGVPFLFVSSSAFQSMFYGQTNRKIRAYFTALRKAARREGGAIGFIEEIDAIGSSRSGMGGSTQREGISGVVNELLIQLQSFDTPPTSIRLRGWFIEQVNRFLPAGRQVRKPVAPPANVLVIGATNRASDLDPALLRPGRFDRSIAFDLPSRAGRRAIIDHYLAKKRHKEEMDDPKRRDTLAAMTFGYSPVMIEHLLDEALVWALRRSDDALTWDDIQKAKMAEEVGLAQPVEYTEAERRTIATHESGHATVAWLAGRSRKLEILSIIKRKDALGLLAHSEREERYTRTRSEMESLVEISLGGMIAEELFFGETSSGVAGDLQTATTLAAQMVGSLGMAGSLVSYEAVQTGGANLVAKVLSMDEGRDRVEEVLESARQRVHAMIDGNRHVVEALRDALLDRDELVGDDILAVIASAAPAAAGSAPRIP